ncbi:MAG: leucine-rich repeat domain-containing protein [Prevotella sp.]|nr:leucine-rich repeat domain-containing protein [Prevotella sp.]
MKQLNHFYSAFSAKVLWLFLLVLLPSATNVSAQNNNTEAGASSGVVLDATNFPDDTFRVYISSITGVAEGGTLSEEKLKSVTSINVSGTYSANGGITSLKGVEHFTALTELYCSNNQLPSLDVSHNTALTGLYCFGNQLPSLDVSYNTALKSLSCGENPMSSLDVSQNTALTSLSCHESQLTSLDVSQNKALTYLDCYDNPLSILDVSQNTALTSFHCYGDQLMSLDLSMCSNISFANVNSQSKTMVASSLGSNQYSIDVPSGFDLSKVSSFTVNSYVVTPTLSNGKLQFTSSTVPTSVTYQYNTDNSVAGNMEVTVTITSAEEASGVVLNADNFPDDIFRAYISSITGVAEGEMLNSEVLNSVTRIEVGGRGISSLKGVEHFTALEFLLCFENQLTSLDVSHNTALKELECGRNQLTSLDVSQNTALYNLQCYYNQLPSLNVSYNTALTTLQCSGNQLTSLDVSQNTALTSLDCSDNQLSSLDVSHNTALTSLVCSSNQLPSLDVSHNTALTWLDCGICQLPSLDVSHNTALTVLGCSGNQLTNLDVSYNTALTNLGCDDNQLTSLELSQNTALSDLQCSSNQLSSLDVSLNTALTVLDCGDNQLTTLDVSGCNLLRYLYCYNNSLTELDVSDCSALELLNCAANQLTSLDVSQHTALTELHISLNRINGADMDALIAGLPSTGGVFYAFDPSDESEHNVLTTTQVAAAKENGWTPLRFSPDIWDWVEYEGSDPQDITPVDQGETVDFGSELDEDTDLDGTVVGDVYFNISSGDGSYDPVDGCIVVTTPTDDSAIDGKDIFGEDFKDNFSGIVFKVAPGKGKVIVEAETLGAMVLKVKIGDNDPIELVLQGKLKMTVPYNVSEESYVYIYGGSSSTAHAKGMRRVDATESALKIYGFEVISDEEGVVTPVRLTDGEQEDGAVYNLNGQRVDSDMLTRKTAAGIYIRNGKKILVK